MKSNDNAQILGALLLSFGQACRNYQFLISEETQFLGRIQGCIHLRADRWGEFLQELTRGKH